jgi:hypothetical protein
MPTASPTSPAEVVLQDLDLLARHGDFLVVAVRQSPPAVAGVWLPLCCFVGQDGILRAGWQPVLCGPFCKLRQAGYQPAAGFQPAPQAGMDSD